MKQVKPGIWVDDELHFELTEEQKKWLEEENKKTREAIEKDREIFKKFLTELQESGRMVPIISYDFDSDK